MHPGGGIDNKNIQKPYTKTIYTPTFVIPEVLTSAHVHNENNM